MPDIKLHCPICNAEVVGYTKRWSAEDEEDWYCPNKCYAYWNGYGNTRIAVENQDFYSHYSMSDEELDRIEKDIQKAINEAKQSYRYIARILAGN